MGALTYTLEQIQKILPGFVFNLVGIEPNMRHHVELYMRVHVDGMRVRWDWEGRGVRRQPSRFSARL